MTPHPLLLCATLAGFSLGGCGLGGPAYDRSPPRVDAVVEMSTLLNYSPNDVSIRVGDTVEWRNTSLVDHTVTADPDLVEDPGNVKLPRGAEAFDSGSVPPGQVYRRRFTVPGEYRYFCIPHEEQGMVGTLRVRPAGS